MALLAAMGMLGGQQPWEDGLSGAGQYLLDGMAEEVGGQDALDSLDGTPLPDEEFGWDEVPADVRERVGEVLAACDRCCDDLLGARYPDGVPAVAGPRPRTRQGGGATRAA